ncbi:MAG: HK97-gp10 family putative phage morphogenesis protein [Oscillospiraceae bacterium]
MDGYEKFMASLDSMTEEIEDVLTKAVEKGADLIVDAQKSLAPSDTGNLRNSIERSPAYESKGSKVNVRCGIDFKKHPDALFAAIISEFGRPGKKSKGVDKLGRRIGKVSARSFIRAGFDARKEQAVEVVAEEVNNFISQKWKGSP